MEHTTSGAPAPREAVSLTSAPEVLLAVVGEYVAPAAGGVWQEMLVEAIRRFGHTAAAARQATARAVRDGALVAHRSGRRSWLQVGESAGRMLRGAASMRDDAAGLRTGLWDVYLIRSVDGGRPTSMHPRTQRLLSGLGRLGPDLWIAPNGPGSALLQHALAEDPELTVIALRSEIVHPSGAEVVSTAWDLDAVRSGYSELLDDYADLDPRTDLDCFIAWTDLQSRWRRCILLDPGLPDGALPAGWPRDDAALLVAERRMAWRGRAVEFFERLGAELPSAPEIV